MEFYVRWLLALGIVAEGPVLKKFTVLVDNPDISLQLICF